MINQESADFLIWRSGQAAAVLLKNAFPAHPSRELVLRSFKEMEYLAAERGWDFRFDPEGVPFFKSKSMTSPPDSPAKTLPGWQRWQGYRQALESPGSPHVLPGFFLLRSGRSAPRSLARFRGSATH